MDWAKTIKHLEKNWGVNLHDFRFGLRFYNMTTKHKQEKIEKLDFIKIKNVYFKGHYQESEKNPQNGKK